MHIEKNPQILGATVHKFSDRGDVATGICPPLVFCNHTHQKRRSTPVVRVGTVLHKPVDLTRMETSWVWRPLFIFLFRLLFSSSSFPLHPPTPLCSCSQRVLYRVSYNTSADCDSRNGRLFARQWWCNMKQCHWWEVGKEREEINP
jgi:hypothetical protein